MKQLTIKQIIKATGGKLVRGELQGKVANICLDSRQAKPGDLFIPLIGEVHDAHKFINEVLENGCRDFIISTEVAKTQLENIEGVHIVMVEDTTLALQNLAAYYLKELNIKKIGVTGSTGKTSTRDMIYYVCSQKYKCGRNVGNLNNHIGVPMTIFSFDETTQVGVIEMGMDHFGEISRLAEIAPSDIGVITNIGMSHMENLGSQEGIFKAKMEITNFFTKDNTLIVSQDNKFLNRGRIKGDYKLISTGIGRENDYIISHIDDFGADGIEFTLEYDGNFQRIKLPVPGRHNAFNGTLAVAVGAQLGITMKEAAVGLSQMELTEKRLTVHDVNGIKVIDDTYNASPDSMKGAIDVLENTKGSRKIAILGDMFELGETSLALHKEVGLYAGEKAIDVVIAIGKNAKFIAEGGKEHFNHNQVHYFPKKEDFIDKLNDFIRTGDVILVKGSRGMAMEEIVKQMINK
ncbi:MAG: UDP-N-acetylmuramoyl-tripeptide--D-alanyl-D-alanine ligase [Anaerovoracaceae bacterium]